MRARLGQGATRTRALADAEAALRGLELLMDVTRVPGLMARGVRRTTEPPAETRGIRPVDGFEWKASAYRVTYRGSSDVEYTGIDYLVAYWLLPEG